MGITEAFIPQAVGTAVSRAASNSAGRTAAESQMCLEDAGIPTDRVALSEKISEGIARAATETGTITQEKSDRLMRERVAWSKHHLQLRPRPTIRTITRQTQELPELPGGFEW